MEELTKEQRRIRIKQALDKKAVQISKMALKIGYTPQLIYAFFSKDSNGNYNKMVSERCIKSMEVFLGIEDGK